MTAFFLSGADNMGWSIDQDRQNVRACLQRLGHKEVSAPWRARGIHSLWWNEFLQHNYRYCSRFTKVLLTCSNYIDPSSELFFMHREFAEARKKAALWLAPGHKQYKVLDNLGLRAAVLPFFINYDMFAAESEKKKKRELCYELGIPWEIFAGKYIIGSFQRDSLGTDLSKPKLQKGPDLLVSILENIPDKHRFILLLAGPRRHYLRKQCELKGIPYFYYGSATSEDDIGLNTVGINVMPKLYRLIDLYMITSTSEGGPKAVIESGASETLCFSTEVGLVHDYLHPSCIFSNIKDYASAVHRFIRTGRYQDDAVEYAVRECRKAQTADAQMKQLKRIYNEL